MALDSWYAGSKFATTGTNKWDIKEQIYDNDRALAHPPPINGGNFGSE